MNVDVCGAKISSFAVASPAHFLVYFYTGGGSAYEVEQTALHS